LRLLVDEDSQSRTLVRLLGEAGRGVLAVAAAGLNAAADREVLQRAILEQRVLLTRNCDDFLALHRELANHAGILAVYQDADHTKNMKYTDVVRALGTLTGSGVSLAREFIVLNAWR
jgi:predicted nuclease of predicted toxin-antitoxin system